jgi:hypothetical protein
MINFLHWLFFQVWGAANTFTSDELLLLNNFAKGFSKEDLYLMDFSSDDVINSFGLVSGYKADQAQKIFEKIKTYSIVASMSGADLLRLGSIALGMSADDINNINTEAFKYVLCGLKSLCSQVCSGEILKPCRVGIELTFKNSLIIHQENTSVSYLYMS